MATNITQQTTGRADQVQSRANRRLMRFLSVSLLGGALLLALAVGIAARQGADTQAVAEAPAAVVPGNAAVGLPYRLSSPNELDTETTGAIPANSAPTVYRVSFPNETNPDDTFFGGAASTSYAPYRVSAPNEQEPSVP
jgi:hypothetical protein